MSGPTPEQLDALEPLTAALLAAAREQARAVVAEAEAEGRRRLAEAGADAARQLTEARARGAQDAAPAVTADRVRASRAARAAVLAAERAVREEVREAARPAVAAVLREPATREHVARLLRTRLAGHGAADAAGDGASPDTAPAVTVADEPDGGLVGRAGARSVHVTAQDLVDAALARVDLAVPRRRP